MALNFPQNPALGDIYTSTEAGTTWEYDGLGWNVVSQDKTLTLTGGNDINIIGSYPDFTIAADVDFPNNFSTFAVATQNSVVADTVGDTITFVAGDNIQITTDNTADSITINSTNTTDLTSFDVTVNPASGGGNLSYDNNGTFTFTPANIPSTSGYLTAADLNVSIVTSQNIPLNSPGNLFWREEDTTLIFTPSDIGNKLSKSDITVDVATASNDGGNLVHDVNNPGTFTFTPADTVKQDTYLWPILELPGGNPPNYVLNVEQYQIFQLQYNTNANWEINIRATTNNSLNNYMQINETITVDFVTPQGATAYHPILLQIDGVTVTSPSTLLWEGGNNLHTGSPGTSNGTDIWRYIITKTAGDTYFIMVSTISYS